LLYREDPMKKLILIAALVFLVPLAAMAQPDYPKAEVFTGYSFFRANPEGFNLNGWNVSVTGNITHWFGIEGDFSGHYGRPTDFGVPIEGVDINSHTVMGGPKFSLRGGPVTPFSHFLLGFSRAGTNDFGLSTSDFAVAAIVGGGIDIHINRTIAVRPFQADYLMTRFDPYDIGARQDNFRFSAGVVFKFGE
jgi:hypothetical protein